MYVPPAFAVPELPRLHEFMERYSFAMLVTQTEQGPFATHLPCLLDRNAGEFGTLVGHVARANPHAELFSSAAQSTDEVSTADSLVLFAGPHAYVSPSWYEESPAVPPWNYQAVHAYGRPVRITEEVELLSILERSVDQYERHRPQPWRMDVDSTFIQRLLPQIVGFRMELTRLEGKFKVSQNQSVARRERVVQQLERIGSDDALAIARAIPLV